MGMFIDSGRRLGIWVLVPPRVFSGKRIYRLRSKILSLVRNIEHIRCFRYVRCFRYESGFRLGVAPKSKTALRFRSLQLDRVPGARQAPGRT